MKETKEGSTGLAIGGALLGLIVGGWGIISLIQCAFLVIRWTGGIQDWPWFSWGSGAVLTPVIWAFYVTVVALFFIVPNAIRHEKAIARNGKIEAAIELGKRCFAVGKPEDYVPDWNDPNDAWLEQHYRHGYMLSKAYDDGRAAGAYMEQEGAEKQNPYQLPEYSNQWDKGLEYEKTCAGPLQMEISNAAIVEDFAAKMGTTKSQLAGIDGKVFDRAIKSALSDLNIAAPKHKKVWRVTINGSRVSLKQVEKVAS